ncbi:hypothetical protein [Microbacterium sp. CIAB417]|uniref:hypothetical protein n=1 Tax=Microbacterium sp. CIAB417 TaxID=2860287 RepID=UPI001FAC7761|nr:hypothetical protein [Microbacterium sp. CIAB417]
MGDSTQQMMPVLSTTDRGTRMTQLAPGQPVGRVDHVLVLRMLAAAALWAVASSVPYMGLLGIDPTTPALSWLGSPWGLAAAVVVAAFAFIQTSSVRTHARRVFGQPRVAGLLGSVTVTGGLAVGAGVWGALSFRMEPAPPFDLTHIVTATDLPRELAVLIGVVFGLWAIFTLVRVGPAIRHARSRQAELARLRETGTRIPGVLTEVTFRNYWLWDDPFFTVQVAYDEDGARRLVAGHMRTSADRVPVVGSRMTVLSDGRGAVSLELDSDAQTVFEDESRYRAPEG